MHQHEAKDDLSVLEKMGYETRDLAAVKAAKYIAWFGFFTTLTYVLSWFIIGLVENISGQKVHLDPSAPIPQIRRLPQEPYPLLQSNRTAWGDMIDLKKKEKQTLNTYGDTAPGKVHIPINKAMDETLAEGLPTRAGAQEEPPK